MKTLRELLLQADPLRNEPATASSQIEFRRQAVLAAVPGSRTPGAAGWWWRPAGVAAMALLVVVAVLLGPRIPSLFVSDVQAAVRFEVKLAEARPAPGLQRASVSGSKESVYLHEETIVTNADIAVARVIPGSGPSQYGVDFHFNAAGAEKMRAATESHIGKHMAILIDSQLVAAPVLRTPISDSAVVTGRFTKAQAERIVNGIGIQ